MYFLSQRRFHLKWVELTPEKMQESGDRLEYNNNNNVASVVVVVVVVVIVVVVVVIVCILLYLVR